MNDTATTTPQPMTDEQVAASMTGAGAVGVEFPILLRIAAAVSKYRDAQWLARLSAQPAPSGEPVLYVHPATFAMDSAQVGCYKPGHQLPGYIPLYTAPQAPSVPDGYALVPVSLIEEVCSSLDDYSAGAPWGEWDRARREQLAALSAAPKASVPDDVRKDAERWMAATDDKRIEGPAVCAWRWDGVDEVWQYRRLTRHEAVKAIDAAIAAAKQGGV